MNSISIFINGRDKTEQSTDILKRDKQQHFSKCRKTWKDEELSYLNPKYYPAILSFSLHRGKDLHSSLPFYFLSDWPPHPNAKKEKMQKVSPFPISPLLCTLSQKCLLRLSVLFFPNNMEGSRISSTLLVIFTSSSTKKQAKKKTRKRYNLMIERLLSNNTSNRFKFTMTSTRVKNLWP